ncbi:MAG: DNA repair protein RecO [Saprospiraceae bacterium]|nr:DNA repair protein RecO [Saprospiraceae bacterium]
MLLKTRGIVFRTLKYAESSIIADIYTEDKGLRKYIFNSVRKAKSRISPSVLQVMSLVDLVAYEREDRDLNRVKEIQPAYVYHTIPFDVKKGAVGLFMAEIIRKTIREEEENRPLFSFIYDNFCHLDQTTHSIANAHLYFMLEFSAYLGFLPGGEANKQTPFFDLSEGVFVSQIPSHLYYLDERHSILLHYLLHASPETHHELKLTREERRHLLQHLLDYYRLHIENFPDIHAHQILFEVLN